MKGQENRVIPAADGTGSIAVVGAGGAAVDINLAQVAGTATVTAGLAGLLAVGGNIADGAANSVDYPVLCGAEVHDAEPAAEAAGDRVHLRADVYRNLNTVPRSHDYATQADRSFEVAPEHTQLAKAELLDEENVNTGGGAVTFQRYIDMDTWSIFSLLIIIAQTVDAVAVTVHGSVEDVADPTTATYVDITNTLFGVASFTGTGNYLPMDSAALALRWIRITTTVQNGGGNDSDVEIHLKKQWH